MNSQQISDADALTYLTAAAAVEDVERRLWSEELVKRATFLWTLNGGKVPTLNAVAHMVGVERAQAMLPEIVKRRQFLNALLGYRSPCHYCGATDGLLEFEFALMRVAESRREWGEATASVALGALTLPLIGMAALKLPGQRHEGQALALKLIVCKACRKEHGNVLGLFMLNEKRASRHPLWGQLQDAGFTKFLDPEHMPLQLKMRATTEL
jgi:hypothetical protein